MSQNNKKQTSAAGNVFGFVRSNPVPFMFILICAVCIPVSGFSPAYLLNEIVTRMGRNVFLILSLPLQLAADSLLPIFSSCQTTLVPFTATMQKRHIYNIRPFERTHRF